LVGARARHRGNTQVAEVYARALLQETFNEPITNFIVHIILCPNLGVPVLGRRREIIPCKFFNCAVTIKSSIFVRQNLMDRWGNITEEVFSGHLNSDVKQAINEGGFSRRAYKWMLFDDMDLGRIDRLL
jgi:hypothetical protein